jgi:Crp-like helix-turn-helix domain
MKSSPPRRQPPPASAGRGAGGSSLLHARSHRPPRQLQLFRTRQLGAHATLARHRQFIVAQAQQSAACHAAHPLEARLSRWLLRCHDLLGSEEIPLTQEFLAEMLGVRRTTVTIWASMLQKDYRRGHIHLIDLEGLRGRACECYETIKAQGKRLLGNPIEH